MVEDESIRTGAPAGGNVFGVLKKASQSTPWSEATEQKIVWWHGGSLL